MRKIAINLEIQKRNASRSLPVKHKIKNLQQQLQGCKKKIGNMAELIDKLQEEFIIKSV